MAKSAKRKTRPAARNTATVVARLEVRRELRQARDRERQIVQLAKQVERATAAADRALASLGMLILDRDAKRSDARVDNEAAHAGR